MSTNNCMQWHALLSTKRFKVTSEGSIVVTRTSATAQGSPGLRTDFHIDHDRVVFCSSFRRLGRKTQVHPLAQHDHTHNRLTHSVEVASVGRSLGNRVGVMLQRGGRLPPGYTPYDIGTVVQVACLAHDIGNPPFGHTGEDALRDWFRQPDHQHYLSQLTPSEQRDIQTYEGNAHGLRIISTLEMYAHEGGMRLSAAVIGSLTKYPWTSDNANAQQHNKFNIYHTELPYFEQIAAELGLIRQSAHSWGRHPLSYLMEAADDICYAILDLEDAVEIGILDVHEFESLFSSFAEYGRVWATQDIRQKCSMLRGIAIGRCVSEVAEKFMLHHDALLSASFTAQDLITLCEPAVQQALQQAKNLASHKVYRHRHKLMTELAAYPCIATILDVLVPAVYAWHNSHTTCVTARQRLALDLMDNAVNAKDSLYQAYMKVLDFTGAMTDNAAAKLAREISGIGIL